MLVLLSVTKLHFKQVGHVYTFKHINSDIDCIRQKYFFRFVWDEDEDATDTWYGEMFFRDLTELKPLCDIQMFVQG